MVCFRGEDPTCDPVDARPRTSNQLRRSLFRIRRIWTVSAKCTACKIPRANRELSKERGPAERFGAQDVEHFTEYSHWLPLEAPDALGERLKAFMGAGNV